MTTTYNKYETLKYTGDLNALANGSAITLGALPANAVVKGGWYSIPAGTTNTTVSIGLTGAATGLANAVNNAAGAVKSTFDATAASRGTKGTTAPLYVLATQGGANAPSTAAAITVWVDVLSAGVPARGSSRRTFRLAARRKIKRARRRRAFLMAQRAEARMQKAS